MAGESLSTAALAFKTAFFDAATALWATSMPAFQVSWGRIGTSVPDQYLEVLGTSNDLEAATMGTNRTREETIRLETMWWVTRFGSPEFTAREADEYLYARLRELEQHIRVDNITLGGAVRQCFLVEHATANSETNRDNTYGRLSAAIAVWEAKVRITREP